MSDNNDANRESTDRQTASDTPDDTTSGTGNPSPDRTGRGAGQPNGQHDAGQAHGQPQQSGQPSHQSRADPQPTQGRPTGGYQRPAGTGLDSNVAAALSYLLAWVSGLVFLVVEEDDAFVRFHAAQSIVVFGGLTVLWVVLSTVFTSLFFTTGGFALFRLLQLLQLLALVAWLALMYLAYDGRWFRVPIAADIADSILAGGNQPVQPRQPRREPAAGTQSSRQHPSSESRSQPAEHSSDTGRTNGPE